MKKNKKVTLRRNASGRYASTEVEYESVLYNIGHSELYKRILDNFNSSDLDAQCKGFENLYDITWFASGDKEGIFPFIIHYATTNSSEDEIRDTLKNIPYVYACYKSKFSGVLVVLCKFKTHYWQLVWSKIRKQIIKDLSVQLNIPKSEIWPRMNSLISFDPDIYINKKCVAFRYYVMPSCHKKNVPMSKKLFEDMGLEKESSLTDIADTVFWYFSMKRKDFILSAARFFALSSHQAGFDLLMSYRYFMKRLNVSKRYLRREILAEFGEVYIN